MKSAPFEYHAAATLAEALSLKHDLGGDARVLAGGQSLMPLMHFRLATPAALVDINPVAELDYVRRANGHVVIGARTRQATMLQSEVAASAAPLLVEAVGWVGHAQIRHRGTVAGSIAHADPSAEIPAAVLALGGEIVCRSVAGERVVPVSEFFEGPFTTAVADDEILTEVRVAVWPEGTGAAWMELSRIYHGFPVVGVGALVHLSDGVVDRASVALCGMAATPVLASAVADVLAGNEPTPDVIAEAAEAAVSDLEPPGDVHGSTMYRKKVGRVYVRRALAAAVENAGGFR